MIAQLHDIEFPPLLRKRIDTAPADRGKARYYITPPFVNSWADSRLIAQPDVLDVVKQIVGDDFVLCQVGVDTPLGGGESETQEIHRDCGPLWESSSDVDETAEPPPYQLACNFPLCDVLPAVRGSPEDRGPLEIHKGSHRMTVKTGQQLLGWGGIACQPIYIRAGDMLIRDV